MMLFAAGTTAYYFLGGLIILVVAVLFLTQRQWNSVVDRSAIKPSDRGATIDDTVERQIAELERLLSAAQQVTQRLEAAIARAEGFREKLPTAGIRPLDVETTPARPKNQAAALAGAAAIGTRQRGPASPTRLPIERPFEQIYALATAGKDPQTIAQEVRCPVGEVELILGLRGKA